MEMIEKQIAKDTGNFATAMTHYGAEKKKSPAVAFATRNADIKTLKKDPSPAQQLAQKIAMKAETETKPKEKERPPEHPKIKESKTERSGFDLGKTLAGFGIFQKKERKIEAKRTFIKAKNNILQDYVPSKVPTPKSGFVVHNKGGINTIFDEMYDIIEQKGSITAKDLARKMNINEKRVLELAEVFEDTKKIEIEYPIIGSPKLVLNKKGEMSE